LILKNICLRALNARSEHPSQAVFPGVTRIMAQVKLEHVGKIYPGNVRAVKDFNLTIE
jgi:hypothetical protein